MEFHTYYRFDELRRDCLALQMRTQSIFTSLEWFELLAKFTTPNHRSVLLSTLTESGPRCFCLPFIKTRNGLASLSNFYTGLFGPIDLGTEDVAFSKQATWELCQQLRRLHPRPAAINISPLDTDGRFFANMLTGLASAGYFTDSYFCFGNWFLAQRTGFFL